MTGIMRYRAVLYRKDGSKLTETCLGSFEKVKEKALQWNEKKMGDRITIEKWERVSFRRFVS